MPVNVETSVAPSVGKITAKGLADESALRIVSTVVGKSCKEVALITRNRHIASESLTPGCWSRCIRRIASSP